MKNNKCFLCEKKLNSKNYTKEHIFPKWLLKKYKLYNERLHFLNGKTMPYSKITIPCCYSCNQKLKKNLEDIISKNNTFEFINEIPNQIIFHWLIKIFLCILFRELNMDVDPKNKLNGNILDKNFVDNFKTLKTFLKNSIDKKIIYKKPFPFSIFIYKINKMSKDNFNFADNVFSCSIAIRYEDFGIIGILEDNGSQQLVLKKFYNKLRRYKLHPIQFDELTAFHFYQAFLFNRTSKYVTVEDEKNNHVFSMSPHGLSSMPVFNPGNANDLNIFLNKYRPQIKLKKMPKDKFLSFLFDEKGKFKKID